MAGRLQMHAGLAMMGANQHKLIDPTDEFEPRMEVGHVLGDCEDKAKFWFCMDEEELLKAHDFLKKCNEEADEYSALFIHLPLAHGLNAFVDERLADGKIGGWGTDEDQQQASHEDVKEARNLVEQLRTWADTIEALCEE